MNLDNQIPILIRHVFEADIPQDASVVEENVYPAKVLNSGVDDSLAVFNAVVVGHSFPSSCSYLINNHVRGLIK